MTGQEFAHLILHTPLISDKRVLSASTLGVIDFFASSLQAVAEPEIQQFRCWIEHEGGHQTRWLIGQKSLATARQAALFNGFQAHFLDYDDVHSEVRGHPSAVILSALFASITPSQTALCSQRFLTAYVIGVEVMARFGAQLNPEHYTRGWHSTATLGTLGAVAAICYLHDYTFLAQAFTLAATQTAGLRLLFGTPIKALHAGLAAQAAVQTVEWLQAGLSADKDFLQPNLGFIAVYGDKSALFSAEQWAQQWRIVKPGLWFKTYPYCSAAAYIADAVAQIRQDYLFYVADIAHIELIFSPQGDAALIYPQPQIKSQGRFSAEYITAKILVGEPLDFAAFSSDPIEPHLLALMQKMQRRIEIGTQRFAAVKVRLKQGDALHKRITQPKGSPENPYSPQEIQHKLETALADSRLAQQLIQDISAWQRPQNIIPFIQKYQNQL